MVSVSPQGHHDCPPETLVRWHRAGFRRYWRWKSRSLGVALTDGISRIGVDEPMSDSERSLEAAEHGGQVALRKAHVQCDGILAGGTRRPLSARARHFQHRKRT